MRTNIEAHTHTHTKSPNKRSINNNSNSNDNNDDDDNGLLRFTIAAAQRRHLRSEMEVEWNKVNLILGRPVK